MTRAWFKLKPYCSAFSVANVIRQTIQSSVLYPQSNYTLGIHYLFLQRHVLLPWMLLLQYSSPHHDTFPTEFFLLFGPTDRSYMFPRCHLSDLTVIRILPPRKPASFVGGDWITYTHGLLSSIRSEEYSRYSINPDFPHLETHYLGDKWET